MCCKELRGILHTCAETRGQWPFRSAGKRAMMSIASELNKIWFNMAHLVACSSHSFGFLQNFQHPAA